MLVGKIMIIMRLWLYTGSAVALQTSEPHNQMNINGKPILHTRNYKHAKCNKLLKNFAHNSVILAVNMLISGSLKWPYLHYKHCFIDVGRKKTHNWRAETPRELENVVTHFLKICKKRWFRDAAFLSGLTFPHRRAFRGCVPSWKDRFLEELCLSLVVQQK